MPKYRLEIDDFVKALAENKSLKKYCSTLATEKVNYARNELIDELTNHPVSKEISAGSDAPNISGTLSSGKGNLFSFIGFEIGSNPVEDFINFVNRKLSTVKVKDAPNKITPRKRVIIFSFIVPNITLSEIRSITRMPWESGNSWVLGIERGISGFSNFMSKKRGRSGGGIQAAGKINDGEYKPTSYWTLLWQKFKDDIK
jgi:hypothetical protein